MRDLEALKKVTSLSVSSDYIKSKVNNFSPVCVVSLRKVITSSTLTFHKILISEKSANVSSTNGTFCCWIKIDEDCSGGKGSLFGLVEVGVYHF
jgi:hypothetical protein